MKTEEQKIMERFQNFDFDKNETCQNKVFSKITQPKKGLRLNFALVSALSVLLLAGAFFIGTGKNLFKGSYSDGVMQASMPKAMPVEVIEDSLVFENLAPEAELSAFAASQEAQPAKKKEEAAKTFSSAKSMGSASFGGSAAQSFSKGTQPAASAPGMADALSMPMLSSVRSSKEQMPQAASFERARSVASVKMSAPSASFEGAAKNTVLKEDFATQQESVVFEDAADSSFPAMDTEENFDIVYDRSSGAFVKQERENGLPLWVKNIREEECVSLSAWYILSRGEAYLQNYTCQVNKDKELYDNSYDKKVLNNLKEFKTRKARKVLNSDEIKAVNYCVVKFAPKVNPLAPGSAECK